ncbi:MAG TPA: serine/threonine-protein kinase [Gemmataceae bacterium]|nr:serine/threonine-protein kinase [Gemmataceae bacterium]
MELSVQNIYGLLIRSKLLPLEDAKAMYQRWQNEAGEAVHDASRFTRWMVANQYVTEYQAHLLARGYADGFFLDHYKILERVGKGRMAGVYRAVHHLGQIVAIKVLPPSKAADPVLLARFQREAQLAMRLKHPNIVRTFQTGETGGLHYLVMEYLEGETLDEVLKRRGRLPPAEAVRLLYQALLGLQHIHEQEMVHRDLKPANLMLVPAPAPGPAESTLACTVKILDIGLGRALFDETITEPDSAPTLTTEGALLGTPDYMAPEQARDARSADIRSDIYSLGCVLYHCLTGQPPFPDSNVLSQMIRHATEPPRPLKQLNPAVPDGLQQIVSVMLAKDPAQRYPTPDRAVQALQAFLSTGGAPPVSPEADPGMRPYLTWLETDGKKAAALPTSAPAAAMVPLPPVAPLPAAESVKKKRSGKRHARQPKRRHSPGAVGAPAAPPIAEPLQIELVPAGSIVQVPRPAPAGFRINRRDFLMFGAGIASTVIAILLGWAAALIVKTGENPPSSDKTDDKP